MHDDELMHYGVLGMKWGVRKSRSSGSSSSKKKSAIKSKASNLKSNASNLKRKVTKTTKKEEAQRKRIDKDYKNRHTMSDKDLAKKIERIQNETKLREVINKEYHPAKSFVTDVLKTSGRVVATAALITGTALLTKIISDKTNNQLLKKWMNDLEKRLNKKK